MPHAPPPAFDDRSFFERFVKELDIIQRTKDLHNRSEALTFWFASNHLHVEDEDDIKERISDGPNDEGIDAIFVDEIEKTIYILSTITVSSFENSTRNLAETELKITFDGFKLITKGDYRGRVNPILEDLVIQYHELQKAGGFDVKVAFVHMTSAPTSLTYAEELKREFPDVKVEFFDFQALKKLYEAYLVYQEPAPNRVPLDVVGKILRNDEEPKALIFTITGRTLANVFLTHGTRIFQRNIRYFLATRGKKSINAQIKATAATPEKSPHFWYYNNGITVVGTKAEVPPNEQVVILEKMQIINGAQTTYSIAKAYSEGILQDNTKVLVKVIESSDADFLDDVTLYTNSQNPVNLRDLASRDEVQTKIQNALKAYGYFYERKRGEFNALYTTDAIKVKEFGPKWRKKIIPNERAAQAYLALFLDKPSHARSRKRLLFMKGDAGFYNDIFSDNLVEERMLIAYKILEFIEGKTAEYSTRYYEAWKKPAKERYDIYKYDFLLQSNFFVLNLFRDFMINNGYSLDRDGISTIISAVDTGDDKLNDIYNKIVNLWLAYIEKTKKEDSTYYHNKFFKSEGSLSLIRNYLRTEKKLAFISVV